MLEIRLLGQFEIRIDGETVTLASRPAQSLLALLLLPPGRRFRREQAAGILWPDTPEAKARSRLRYALWQLRQAIGENVLRADKISISFDPSGEYWLDTAALAANPAVYQGDLLPGFYEDWVAVERSHLRSLFEQKMEAAIPALLAGEQYGRLIEHCEHWIGVGQPSEKAYRGLMAGHALMGDASAAAQSYQRCVVFLRDELDAAPSNETLALQERIRAGAGPDDILAASGFDLPRDPHLASDPALPEISHDEPLVGREEDLAWLEEKWLDARAGRGSFALLIGESGRGKSALMRAFARRVQENDPEMVFAAGRGEAFFGQGDPYLLFRDLLALLAGDVEGRSEHAVISTRNAERLWKIAPDTLTAVLTEGTDLIGSLIQGDALLSRAKRFSTREPGPADRLEALLKTRRDRPEAIHIAHGSPRRALFDQVTRVIQTLAESRPLLLLLDDLHWADRGSLDLLFHLARRLEDAPILILGAVRPEALESHGGEDSAPLPQMLAEFGRIFGAYQLDLDQADSRRGDSLAQALANHQPNRYPPGFKEKLYEITRGHPLFTLELLRQLQEQGDLAKDESGRWYVRREIDWGILPVRVESVIAGRILGLSPQEREVLSIASIEGETFTAEVLAAVLEQPVRQVMRLLDDELYRRHRLVEPAEMRREGDRSISRYNFHHQIFQRYLYDRQDRFARRRLHEQLAGAIENIYAGSIDSVASRLALHFEQAERLDETLRWLKRAGEYAKRRSAEGEAVRLFEHGLDLLEKLPPSAGRDQQELAFQVSLGAPAVAHYGYHSAEAEKAFERARVLAERLGESEELPSVLWGLWSYYLVRGRQDRALEIAKQINQPVQQDALTAINLTAQWTLGISLAVNGNFVRAKGRLQRAIKVYEAVGSEALTYRYGQNPAVTCLSWLGFCQWVTGDEAAGYASLQRMVALADEEGHGFSRVFARVTAASFLAVGGRTEGVRRLAEEGVVLAGEAGYFYNWSMGLVCAGWAAVQAGDMGEEAVSNIQRGLATMEKSGARLGLAVFTGLYADACLVLGLLPEGLAAVDRALAFAAQDGEKAYLPELHRIKAELLAGSGADRKRIAAELDAGNRIAEQQKASFYTHRITAAHSRLLAEESHS